MSRRRGLAALACALWLQGCSFLAGTHQEVVIVASDPRAQISVDGREVGVGRAAPRLSRGEAHRVKAEVDGRRVYANLGQTVSGLGFVDLVLGALFGVHFLGLLAPGFWELTPAELNLQLPEAPR